MKRSTDPTGNAFVSNTNHRTTRHKEQQGTRQVVTPDTDDFLREMNLNTGAVDILWLNAGLAFPHVGLRPSKS
jgi:hypothetical protein